jgi:PHD/YefM family antitoxin component YafN of YafNO toxin-antitoxin module
MQTLTANHAKTRFGEMLINIQHEPIQIQKNGEAVAVIMSCKSYQEFEDLKIELLKSALQRADHEEKNGLLTDGELFFNELESGQHD